MATRRFQPPALPTQVQPGPNAMTLRSLLTAIRTWSDQVMTRLGSPFVLDTYTDGTGPDPDTRPAAADNPGAIIYVSDGAAGSKFQGSDGSSWVSLG